jgi:hypothetical protein
MDFIIRLPLNNRSTNYIVITDRFGKGVIFEDLPDIEIKTVAERFIRYFYKYHGLSNAIISDRGG